MNMEILPNFRTLQIQKHFHQSSVGRIKRTKNLENWPSLILLFILTKNI